MAILLIDIVLEDVVEDPLQLLHGPYLSVVEGGRTVLDPKLGLDLLIVLSDTKNSFVCHVLCIEKPEEVVIKSLKHFKSNTMSPPDWISRFPADMIFNIQSVQMLQLLRNCPVESLEKKFS